MAGLSYEIPKINKKDQWFQIRIIAYTRACTRLNEASEDPNDEKYVHPEDIDSLVEDITALGRILVDYAKGYRDNLDKWYHDKNFFEKNFGGDRVRYIAAIGKLFEEVDETIKEYKEGKLIKSAIINYDSMRNRLVTELIEGNWKFRCFDVNFFQGNTIEKRYGDHKPPSKTSMVAAISESDEFDLTSDLPE